MSEASSTSQTSSVTRGHSAAWTRVLRGHETVFNNIFYTYDTLTVCERTSVCVKGGVPKYRTGVQKMNI